LAETKGIFEELDQWIGRKLRCIIWRQWKKPKARLKALQRLGFTPVKAATSAYNGYGPWWNSGQAHMNAALPQAYFARLGLISLLQTIHARA